MSLVTVFRMIYSVYIFDIELNKAVKKLETDSESEAIKKKKELSEIYKLVFIDYEEDK